MVKFMFMIHLELRWEFFSAFYDFLVYRIDAFKACPSMGENFSLNLLLSFGILPSTTGRCHSCQLEVTLGFLVA